MYLFLSVVLVLIVVLVSFLEWWKHHQQRGLKMPPRHPYSWPVIGLAHLVFRIKDTNDLLKIANSSAEMCHENGGICYGYVGSILVFAVTDPDICRTVLNTCLEKKYIYNLGKNFLGDGIFSVTDNLALWRRHRKIISRAFNQQVLDTYMDTFNNKSRLLVDALAQKVKEGPFEHFGFLGNMSLGIMIQSTMGLEDEIFKDIDSQKYEDFHRISNILATRFQSLWMISDWLYNFTSLKKEEDQFTALLNNVSDSIIQRKREIFSCSEKNKTKTKSFLDLIMDLPAEDAFSDQELKDEVHNIIIAGSDTTATTLTFALILLGSYKDVQEDVCKELKHVFGDSDRDVEKEDLSKLILLDAVLMETIRLYPTVSILPRYVSKDVQLKNCTLPAGSTCLVFANHVHRNPDLWGEDSKLFRPQRWIEGVSPAAASAFAGFSIGKRNCIGRTNAMMSMKTTLAHVLRHYKIDADVTKLELQLDLVLKPASGCEISVLPRK